MKTWTDRLRLILVSALQVDQAVLFSAAITVAAFVPLFTMQGVEGQIFGPMARTYGYALVGALIATFTVTPVLASLLLPDHVKEVETFLVRWLRAAYTPVLRWSLDQRADHGYARRGVLGCNRPAGDAPRQRVPAGARGGQFLDSRLDAADDGPRRRAPPRPGRCREILLRHPEVITVVSQHGRPDNGSDASPFSNVELFVPLKPFDQWPAGLTKDKLTNELQREFAAELPGVNFNFSQYIQDNVEEALSGVKGANSVKIIGPNLGSSRSSATEIRDQMAQVRGVQDLGIFHVLGPAEPQHQGGPRKGGALRPQHRRREYRDPGGDGRHSGDHGPGRATASSTSTVRLRRATATASSPSATSRSAIKPPAAATAYIPLRELATITLDTGASYIYHESTKRYMPIKFSVRGRDLGSTVAEAQARIAKNVKLPTGYRLVWAGEFEDLQHAKQRLEVIVPISLVLILVLLYGLFNSLRDSLLALAGIPFAIGGGIIALYVTGLSFSISAAIGFISLFGVSVMNGILIITYYNQLRLQRHGAAPRRCSTPPSSGCGRC